MTKFNDVAMSFFWFQDPKSTLKVASSIVMSSLKLPFWNWWKLREMCIYIDLCDDGECVTSMVVVLHRIGWENLPETLYLTVKTMVSNGFLQSFPWTNPLISCYSVTSFLLIPYFAWLSLHFFEFGHPMIERSQPIHKFHKSVARFHGNPHGMPMFVASTLSGWWFGTFYIFPYMGNNHPNWRSYFSEGLKPWTSYLSPWFCHGQELNVTAFQLPKAPEPPALNWRLTRVWCWDVPSWCESGM